MRITGKPFTVAGAALACGLVLGLTSGTAFAQDAAAASLPNAFDNSPRAAAPVPVQAVPTDEAPDVARGRETLMAVIEDAQDGELDFTAFSEDVAGRLRPIEADLTSTIQGFGTLEDIAYVGHQGGADMFAVRFDSVLTQWVIGFDADDRIAVLLFREAPADAAAAAAN